VTEGRDAKDNRDGRRKDKGGIEKDRERGEGGKRGRRDGKMRHVERKRGTLEH